jgi:hypothetical protein
MRFPQVINLLQDAVMAFDGDTVIDDTDQVPLGSGKSITLALVDVDVYDLMSNSHAGTAMGLTMTYRSSVDFWTIDIVDLYNAGILQDKRKYVARVSESSGGTVNMRDFKVDEFCVDNDSLEDVLMKLPYQVEIADGEAWIRWYDYTANFGNPASIKYSAQAYEGGVGTTFATDPSRVTHRGPVIGND